MGKVAATLMQQSLDIGDLDAMLGDVADILIDSLLGHGPFKERNLSWKILE